MVMTDSNTTWGCDVCGEKKMSVERHGGVCPDCRSECDVCSNTSHPETMEEINGRLLCYWCRIDISTDDSGHLDGEYCDWCQTPLDDIPDTIARNRVVAYFCSESCANAWKDTPQNDE